MTKGISEKKLISKRKQLRADIKQFEKEEKENSALIHKVTAKKTELRAKVIEAKNRLVLIEQHIKDCEELKASQGG